MRIVLDTNILVSAALKRQSTPGVATHLVQQSGGLLKSRVTEQQLFEVIARSYFVPLIDPEAHAWLSELMAGAELVAITGGSRLAAILPTTNFWSWPSTATPI